MEMINAIKALFKPMHNPIQAWYWNRRYEYYRQKYPFINSEAWFNGYGIIINGNGYLEIEPKSKLSGGSQIKICEGTRIQIGAHCMILQNVHMKTWKYNRDDYNILEYGNIKIGSYCYIGYGTVIEPGVTIGHHVHIMPNSYIDEDIPAGAIVKSNMIIK